MSSFNKAFPEEHYTIIKGTNPTKAPQIISGTAKGPSSTINKGILDDTPIVKHAKGDIGKELRELRNTKLRKDIGKALGISEKDISHCEQLTKTSILDTHTSKLVGKLRDYYNRNK